MKQIILRFAFVFWMLTGAALAMAQESTLPAITVDNAGQITEWAMLGRGGLKDVAWSSDGNLLAVNGSAAIWLYHVTDFEAEPRVLTQEAGIVHDLAFSPDGRTLATTSNFMVALWDVSTGERLRIVSGGYELGSASQLAFSPDGQTLAHLVNNQLILWDLTTGDMLPAADSSRYFWGSGVTDFTFSPDGALFAWSTFSGAVYVWDIAAQKTAFIFREDALINGFDALAFSPDDKTLTARGCTQLNDERQCVRGRLWFWDVETQTLRQTLEVPVGPMESEIVYSPDGAWLATPGSDDQIILLNTETGDLQQRFASRGGWYLSLSFSPDGTRLAAARYDDIIYSPFGDSAVYIWDMATGEVQHIMEGTGLVQCVAFSADEKLLASGYFKGIIRLWDVQSHSVIKQFETRGFVILSVAFTRDGRVLLARDDQGTVWQWDVETGQLQQELSDIESLGQNPQLSPSGAIVTSIDSANARRVWDPISGSTLATVRFEAGMLEDSSSPPYVLSPDGTITATIDKNYSVIHLSDTATGVSRIILDGHTDRPRSLRFSVDGAYLLSSGDDGTLRLWDTHTGAMLRVIEYFDAESGRVFSFGADDTLVATGEFYGMVRLYNAATAEKLATLHAANHEINRIVFSPMGTYMALAVDDGTIRLWGIP